MFKICLNKKVNTIVFDKTILKCAIQDDKDWVINMIQSNRRLKKHIYQNYEYPSNIKYNSLDIIKELKDRFELSLREAKELWRKLSVNL